MPARGADRDAHAPALRQFFPSSEVTLSPRSLPSEPSTEVRPTPRRYVLTLPIARTRWQLVLHRDEKFSRGERFLAQLVSAHLTQVLGDAAPSNRKPRRLARPIEPGPELGLTSRETEVLRWIIKGKRDAQIATLLGVARRTVSKHVENILRKLGAETRSGAALVAADRLGTASGDRAER